MNSGMSYGTIPRGGQAAQFYIMEVDENNRVRVLPFNILTGKFFTRQTEGKPDEQLIWYIPTPSDPDTFTYTRDRWTDSAPPYLMMTRQSPPKSPRTAPASASPSSGA